MQICEDFLLSHYPSYSFEKSWQSGEVSTDWKKGSITTIFKSKKELQASQSHLCAWQDHGTDPPVNYAKACGKQGDDW